MFLFSFIGTSNVGTVNLGILDVFHACRRSGDHTERESPHDGVYAFDGSGNNLLTSPFCFEILAAGDVASAPIANHLMDIDPSGLSRRIRYYGCGDKRLSIVSVT